MESQQRRIPAADQEKDWAWKIGEGEKKEKKASLWNGKVFFYRFIDNFCIKYFNSDNLISTMYIQKDLMVLELKRKISLSHSICQSILQHHSFIWLSKLKVKLGLFFFLKLSVCLFYTEIL